MSEPKRFEDWNEVDCNDCQHYWTDACDGVSKGSEKPCNSFLATRKVNILGEIEALRKRLNTLNVCCILYGIAFVLHVASHYLGG